VFVVSGNLMSMPSSGMGAPAFENDPKLPLVPEPTAAVEKDQKLLEAAAFEDDQPLVPEPTAAVEKDPKLPEAAALEEGLKLSAVLGTADGAPSFVDSVQQLLAADSGKLKPLDQPVTIKKHPFASAKAKARGASVAGEDKDASEAGATDIMPKKGAAALTASPVADSPSIVFEFVGLSADEVKKTGGKEPVQVTGGKKTGSLVSLDFAEEHLLLVSALPQDVLDRIPDRHGQHSCIVKSNNNVSISVCLSQCYFRIEKMSGVLPVPRSFSFKKSTADEAWGLAKAASKWE
jgi:hypothetical protein